MPGVTAGVAAPAYAGIPVTQRGVSAAVAFVTGHEDPAKPDTLIDWPALAAFPGTLVFYMGVRSLDRIAEQLVAGGRPAEPARRGRPARHVRRPAHGQRDARRHRRASRRPRACKAPAITVVGDVAALHDELAWFGAGPLAGRSVAVTRARAQASPLAARLRALGASVVEAPAIRIEPLDATLPDLAGFDLLCVTSPNGARRLLELVPRRARPARARDRRDRPRHRRRAARGRHRGRRRPRARRRRVARRGARRPARAPRADRPRRAGARRPARRAARARRRGRDPPAVPDGRRAARRRRPRRRARRRLRDVHLGLRGALLRRGGGPAGRSAARLDRPDHERRAARARPRARTSRRPSTRPTASSPRCSKPPRATAETRLARRPGRFGRTTSVWCIVTGCR